MFELWYKGNKELWIFSRGNRSRRVVPSLPLFDVESELGFYTFRFKMGEESYFRNNMLCSD